LFFVAIVYLFRKFSPWDFLNRTSIWLGIGLGGILYYLLIRQIKNIPHRIIDDERLKSVVERIKGLHEKLAKIISQIISDELQQYMTPILHCQMVMQNVICQKEETHTRTANVTLDLYKFYKAPTETLASLLANLANIEIPNKKAVIYGWYDDELGSYTNIHGDLTIKNSPYGLPVKAILVFERCQHEFN
jgi:hypothetical protein